jgi:hypothetical protein
MQCNPREPFRLNHVSAMRFHQQVKPSQKSWMLSHHRGQASDLGDAAGLQRSSFPNLLRPHDENHHSSDLAQAPIRAAVKGQPDGLGPGRSQTLSRSSRAFSRTVRRRPPQRRRRGFQILFSNSLMASISFCWLSAMSLASVIASGCLPELISVWAVVIAP